MGRGAESPTTAVAIGIRIGGGPGSIGPVLLVDVFAAGVVLSLLGASSNVGFAGVAPTVPGVTLSIAASSHAINRSCWSNWLPAQSPIG